MCVRVCVFSRGLAQAIAHMWKDTYLLVYDLECSKELSWFNKMPGLTK